MPITPYNAKRGLADPAGVALFSENPSGFVDHELSVDEMPVALLDYQRHRKRSDGVKGPDGVREDAQCCRMARQLLQRGLNCAGIDAAFQQSPAATFALGVVVTQT